MSSNCNYMVYESNNYGTDVCFDYNDNGENEDNSYKFVCKGDDTITLYQYTGLNCLDNNRYYTRDFDHDSADFRCDGDTNCVGMVTRYKVFNSSIDCTYDINYYTQLPVALNTCTKTSTGSRLYTCYFDNNNNVYAFKREEFYNYVCNGDPYQFEIDFDGCRNDYQDNGITGKGIGSRGTRYYKYGVDCYVESDPIKSNDDDTFSLGLNVIVILPAVLILLVICIIGRYYYQRRKRKQEMKKSGGFNTKSKSDVHSTDNPTPNSTTSPKEKKKKHKSKLNLPSDFLGEDEIQDLPSQSPKADRSNTVMKSPSSSPSPLSQYTSANQSHAALQSQPQPQSPSQPLSQSQSQSQQPQQQPQQQKQSQSQPQPQQSQIMLVPMQQPIKMQAQPQMTLQQQQQQMLLQQQMLMQQQMHMQQPVQLQQVVMNGQTFFVMPATQVIGKPINVAPQQENEEQVNIRITSNKKSTSQDSDDEDIYQNQHFQVYTHAVTAGEGDIPTGREGAETKEGDVTTGGEEGVWESYEEFQS